jgi:predicted branched-subunit amino acid permease
MRSFYRTLERSLVRDLVLVSLANGVVGASFGAIAVAGGQPAWVALLMSPLVFAGGAQFAALGVVLSGGTAVAAVVAGLVLNLRLLPFGLAVTDVLAVSWPKRLVGSHLIFDESVAFVMTQQGLSRRRAVFAVFGVLMYLTWNLGTVIGVLAGQVIGDPHALGLDAAAPTILLALVLPVLRDTGSGSHALRASLVGAAIALLATPVLPAGLPVLLALLGVLVVVSHKPRPAGPPSEEADPA